MLEPFAVTLEFIPGDREGGRARPSQLRDHQQGEEKMQTRGGEGDQGPADTGGFGKKRNATCQQKCPSEGRGNGQDGHNHGLSGTLSRRLFCFQTDQLHPRGQQVRDRFPPVGGRCLISVHGRVFHETAISGGRSDR